MATDRTVLVRLKANVGDFVAGMSTARAAVRGVTSEIDTTNDRVAWLSQGILGIGPALIPLGAAAIPVLSGIATQATVAAGAVGVMALAFVGVGDTLKAVNEYQLEPTAANFEKLQLAMDKIGPSGAEFVMFLDSLGPQLRSLQMLSRDGIFPGAQEGLEELMTLLPRARGLVYDMADAIGDLMAQAGGELAGDGFEEFFDFLDRNARPILTELSQSIGNFALGFANMLVGFEPLSQGFSKGLLDMSRSFREWSAGLADDADFQQFMAYIEDSIPKALEFGGALSHAFVAILEAAAPVGDVMLPALSKILEVIAALADSPIGPVFIAAAAAMSIYGRAVALASVSTTGLGKGIKTMGANALAGTSGLKTLAADLRSMAGEYERTGKAQSVMLSGMSQTTGSAQRAAASVKALGRSAALIGGLALATSSYGQQMDLASTATYAMMGFLIGGAPGAVAGGVVGATMDLAKANGKAAESQKQLAQELRAAGVDMAAWETAVTGAMDRAKEHADDIHSDSIGEFFANAFDPSVITDFTRDAFGMETVQDQMDKASADVQEKFGDIQLAARLLAEQMNLLGTDGSASMSEMTQALQQAQPAMAALGITTDDLMAAVRDGSIMDLIGQMAAWQTQADSTAGRTDAVVTAMAGLDDQLTSTADSANTLIDALDKLMSPKLNLSEATDAWTLSLKELHKDLAKNSRTLLGNSQAALTNRDAIRTRISAMKDVLAAEAEAGAGAGKLSTTLRRQVGALLDAGAAAGMSRKELRKYITEMGLTPKLVKTLIQNNAPGAKNDVDALNNALNNLDGKVVRTIIQVIRKGAGIVADAIEGGPHLAGGGLVRGPGGPTDDIIPAWLSDREYVMRNAAVEKYGLSFMHAVNALKFADGGLATNTYTRRQDAPDTATDRRPHDANQVLITDIHLLSMSLKGLRRELDKSQKAVDRERAARDAVQSLMDQAASDVSSGLRDDPFAQATNPWAAAASGGATGVLNADTAQADEFASLIQSLQGKGLTGPALAELAAKAASQNSTALLKAYDAMSASDLAAYSAAYTRREKALASAGATTGSAAYGADYAKLDGRLEEQIKELREIKWVIKASEKKRERDKKKNASDGKAGGGSDAPNKARRRARRV